MKIRLDEGPGVNTEYPTKNILKFHATPGFGKWKRFFPDEAVEHPARVNLNLLKHLIIEYTKKGILF
jgi:hypothetical protein